MKIITVKTKPFTGQKFGTSGLRKKTKIFEQPSYLENFLQAIFNTIQVKNQTLVLGGDGRYFNKTAILTATRMLIAGGAKKIYIGQNGLFSTPAISHFIRKYQLNYGVIFSASHNPAGKNGDFGIKVNGSNGSGINETLSEKIDKATLDITEYTLLDEITLDITSVHTIKILNTEIEVVDPVIDYSLYMEEIFDFAKIKNFLQTGFKIIYEGFNAVTGIYAKDIFHNRLGIECDNLYNIQPLEDFGGLHADPNRIYAKHLIDKSKEADAPDIIFASDGDGDRNLIIGKGILVSPSDSLAVLLSYAHLIKYYNGKVFGVARSLPTSKAVDLVAKKLNIPSFAVPTGWKFFGNLLEAKKITFCGEESCGTGSNHIGEKDGIWAMLFWLNIVAETNLTVLEIVHKMWAELGRYYYVRLDYEEAELELAESIFNNISSLHNQSYQGKPIKVSKFSYTDSVTGELSLNKAEIIDIGKDSRVILRRSGTGTDKATVRIYLETYEPSNIYLENVVYMQDLIDFIINKLCNNIAPSIID